MDTNKLIAEMLLEIAHHGFTEIIDSAKNDELINAAKKVNITLPDPDIAMIKTVYAEIDKVNKNGFRLPRKAVEAGLPSLIGKQVNWEHDGAGRICGYIIDANIEGDSITVIAVLFKSFFKEEMEVVKEKFASKELSVSFEIWGRTQDKKSVLTKLADGSYIIDPILFQGMGLLLNSKPACPNAKVKKLLASIETNKEIFAEDLIYASLAINKENYTKEENKVDEIYLAEVISESGTISLELPQTEVDNLEADYEDIEDTEVKKSKYDERKTLKDEAFAVILTLKSKTTGEPRKICMFPLSDEANIKNSVARLEKESVKATLQKLGVAEKDIVTKIVIKAKELGLEEIVKQYNGSVEPTMASYECECLKCGKVLSSENHCKDIKCPDCGGDMRRKDRPGVGANESTPAATAGVEEVSELKKLIKRTVIDANIMVEIPEGDGYKVDRTGHYKEIREYSDGTSETVEEERASKFQYTVEDIEAAKAAIRAEYELKLKEKDDALLAVKTENENALKEKDTEIVNLKAELDTEKAKTNKENSAAPIQATAQEPDLNVGDNDDTVVDPFVKIRADVDEAAFGKQETK